jgi:hypothetical protein
LHLTGKDSCVIGLQKDDKNRKESGLYGTNVKGKAGIRKESTPNGSELVEKRTGKDGKERKQPEPKQKAEPKPEPQAKSEVYFRSKHSKH